VIIEAAGGVVLRRPADRVPEVLVVHRPKYDDWSLPKGKLERAETPAEAAVREVEEEASLKINLAAPLDRTSHRIDDKTEKRVWWWTANHSAAETSIAFRPSKEVDQVAWLPVTEADRRLSYQQDQVLLAQALEQPRTTPLIIVRHSKAINRKDWDGSDPARPLRARGRIQSRRLIPLLGAYGISELITSPWLRCFATMQPYALNEGISQQKLHILSEDAAADDPEAVVAAMDEIRERTVVDRSPTAVCCHRPVLPDMLLGLDLPAQTLTTAECLILHLTDTAEVHAVERMRPLA